MKLSEKGYEQRSEREFGRYTEEEMGPWVVCRAIRCRPFQPFSDSFMAKFAEFPFETV
jgi:hypothetical protein